MKIIEEIEALIIFEKARGVKIRVKIKTEIRITVN